MNSFEPLLISTDSDGNHEFASRPEKAIIDIYGIGFAGPWIKINRLNKTVELTLNGETLTYKRVAKTLAGHWACERVS